jgi:hypothetical protein
MPRQGEVVMIVVALAILALFIVIGLCVYAGRTADSRDTRFSLWQPASPAAKSLTINSLSDPVRRSS